jgi:hypothetical protein
MDFASISGPNEINKVFYISNYIARQTYFRFDQPMLVLTFWTSVKYYAIKGSAQAYPNVQRNGNPCHSLRMIKVILCVVCGIRD